MKIRAHNPSITVIQLPKGPGLQCSYPVPGECTPVCTCGDKSDWTEQLSDLEVMEGLLEFARKLRNDPDAPVRRSGHAQEEGWREQIAVLRGKIPNCFLVGYDSERRKGGDRPDCDCPLCLEERGLAGAEQTDE